MAITFVIHEATRTGAPRLGALIARELARDEDVRVIAMKDGPLTPWLRRTLGAHNLVVCRGEPFRFQVPFEQRVRLAREMLAEDSADLVYVNSLAASVFALAGALDKRRTLLHVHEKKADMLGLLIHDVTKLEIMRVVDAAVLAAEDISADLAEVFQYAPPQSETFGIAVEVDAIRAAAAERIATTPRNARGASLSKGSRLLVGMSGHGSVRKGADIFLETAAALPQCDFLWLGGWRPEETKENSQAFAEFERLALPNVYLAGSVENPYPYMRMLDLFFLSSREDPNPLVLAESLALDLPILCFSNTTAIADRLGRYAIVCHGDSNAQDAVRVLKSCTPEAVRRPAFRQVGEAFVAEYDLREKMTKVRDMIARLRGHEPAPAPAVAVESDDAAQRDLGQGVVELTFS